MKTIVTACILSIIMSVWSGISENLIWHKIVAICLLGFLFFWLVLSLLIALFFKRMPARSLVLHRGEILGHFDKDTYLLRWGSEIKNLKIDRWPDIDILSFAEVLGKTGFACHPITSGSTFNKLIIWIWFNTGGSPEAAVALRRKCIKLSASNAEAVVKYYACEIAKKYSKDLSEFYNERDHRQQVRFKSTFIPIFEDYLQGSGIEVTGAMFEIAA
jgi:hypothetical protein